MLVVLRTLARPWRVVHRARVLKDTLVTHLRQILDLQSEVKAEVRELHQSGLLAAIHVIEEQRRARTELDQEFVRLERRLAALEAQLDAARENAAGGSASAFDRAA